MSFVVEGVAILRNPPTLLGAKRACLSRATASRSALADWGTVISGQNNAVIYLPGQSVAVTVT